jgi:hypothetical protein
MVDATYIDNDRLQVIQNSDISFDTNRPSITLFPDSARIVQTRTITFPSPVQARAYYRNVSGGTVCELWSTLISQSSAGISGRCAGGSKPSGYTGQTDENDDAASIHGH